MICQNPTWQGISRTPSTNSQNVPRQAVGNCRARSPIRRWKHQQGSPSSECAVEHPSARPACLAWCKSQAPQKGLTSSSWPLSPFLFHSARGLALALGQRPGKGRWKATHGISKESNVSESVSANKATITPSYAGCSLVEVICLSQIHKIPGTTQILLYYTCSWRACQL